MSKQGFKVITLFAALLLLVSAGCAQKSNTDVEQLVKNGAFLVDVRTPAEFAEGHVAGSVNIPLTDIEKELGQFKDKEQIVVFCRSGARSGQALQILNKNGFTNVSNGGSWTQVNQYLSR